LTGGNNEATLYVEGVGGSSRIGDLRIKAQLDIDGDGPAPFQDMDAVRVTVFRVMEVHPGNDDFKAGKKGRVLISALHDDLVYPDGKKRYYTKKATTKAGKVAQTADAEVVVSAYVVPKAKDVNVYFEVTDPDDKSPYDGKTRPTDPEDKNPNDNRDAKKKMDGTIGQYNTFQRAALSARSARTTLATINGKRRAVAEITLKITNRHSGDNYLVRATCANPAGKPFDTLTGITASPAPPVVKDMVRHSATMVAWKRVYLEMDRMYKKGGTILQAVGGDADDKPDVIHLDNVSDFKKKDGITIFSPTTRINTRVISVNAANNTITVPDLNRRFVRFDGVKLRRSDKTFSVPLDYLEMTYGGDTAGTDGGCFVEFKRILPDKGSAPIPKYTRFPNELRIRNYDLHWFDNFANKTNIVQLVASIRKHINSFGSTIIRDHRINIWLEVYNAFPIHQRLVAVKETTMHEIGHFVGNLRKREFGHVDLHINHPNHEGSDQCLMSYNRNRTDGKAEFCIECIHKIRDIVDPR